MKRDKNQYLIYYLKENILILDVFSYLECLAADTVDHLNDWYLVDNQKVNFKKTLIKEFLTLKIKKFSEYFCDLSKRMGCSTVCFYKENTDFKEWFQYYEDPNRFIKCCKSICKKNLPNFYENKNENVKLFQKIKGRFENIPCLLPTGEDEYFLQKILKKIQTTP